MAFLDAYARLLSDRGTRRSGATEAEISALRARHGDLPEAILAMLRVQNGEDPMLTFQKGYRFVGATELREEMDGLREMVEVDETLPPAFLDFVPFLHCEVKSDVGVFRPSSGQAALGVIEYHYETGEFVRWSSSIEDFIESLAAAKEPFNRLGTLFPMSGLDAVDCYAHPWA